MTTTDQPDDTPKDSSAEGHVEVNSFKPASALFWLLLVGFAALAGYFYVQSKGANSGLQDEIIALRQEKANSDADVARLEHAFRLSQQEKSIARVSLLDADAKARQAEAATAQFQTEYDKWHQTTAALLATDEGKRIAAERDSLEKFYGFYTKQPSSARSPAELRQDLNTVMPNIKQALEANDSPYKPGENVISTITKVTSHAQEAAEVFRMANRQVQALLASAPQPVADDTPLLKHALDALQIELAQQRNERTQQLIQEDLQDNAQRVAAAKRAEGKVLADADIAASEKYAEMGAKNIEDALRQAHEKYQADRAAAEAERKRKLHEQRYKDARADIQRYLSCFFLDGYTQPKGAAGETITTKGPVSLTALRTSGLLTDDIQHLSYLSHFTNRVSKRQPSSIPLLRRATPEANALEQTKRAQDLLKEFGDDLVKDGLLAP